jgi:hypothetical protein
MTVPVNAGEGLLLWMTHHDLILRARRVVFILRLASRAIAVCSALLSHGSSACLSMSALVAVYQCRLV